MEKSITDINRSVPPHRLGASQAVAAALLVLAWVFCLGGLHALNEAPFSSAFDFDDPAQVTPASAADLPQATESATTIRLGFVGDIMQHLGQANDDFQACYANVKPLIQGFDLAVGNLEFPVCPDRPVGPPLMSAQFNGSLAHLDALANAGFDVLCTANNHAFDQGLEGVGSTLDAIAERNLVAVGTAKRQPVPVPVCVDVRGIRIGFVAYTFRPNSYAKEGTTKEDIAWWSRDSPILEMHFLDWTDEYRAKGRQFFREHVQASKNAKVDLLVALVHWGEEWHFQPSDDQRLAAHDMIDAGFDLVVGGHSHVIGPPEVYRGRLIAYSLGNFISDFVPVEARTGAVLEVIIESANNASNVGVSQFRYYPLQTQRSNHQVNHLRSSLGGKSGRELCRTVLGVLSNATASTVQQSE